MVKICGITNREDAERAVELGADMLGFVFADSKRRARPELLPQLRELPVLKVAVVVADRAHGRLPPEVAQLLAEGLLDAVQLHGAEEPQECFETAYPYYKALRPQTPAEADRAAEYRSPRVLFDAFDRSLHGGTGKRLNEGIVLHIAEQMPLWLAGGLGPGNIREIVRRFCPELVDASSSLEAEPGRKDHAALQTYFEEIRHGCTSA
jgi:indole-3-glycerol phosphate synthase/phosphoribosylanthranilate isomerase